MQHRSLTQLRSVADLPNALEQFERARDQAVRSTRVDVTDGVVDVTLEATDDVTVAQWAAERQGDVFERAFGKELRVHTP